jgi:hypothetical protein
MNGKWGAIALTGTYIALKLNRAGTWAETPFDKEDNKGRSE